MLLLLLFMSMGAIIGPIDAKKKVVTCYYDATGSFWNGYDKACDCEAIQDTEGAVTWKKKPNKPDCECFAAGTTRYEVKDLDSTHCTHLIYAFAKLSRNKIASSAPYLDLKDDYGLGNYKTFTKFGKTNDITTLLAIGGATDSKITKGGVSIYSTLVADKTLRKAFIDDAILFLKKYDFEGLDLDWEFPAYSTNGGRSIDKENFAKFVKELKAAFVLDGTGLLLTAAVGNNGEAGYKHADLYKNLDYVHLMTYDFGGYWGKDSTTAIHNAPMSFVKGATSLTKTWTDKICSKNEKKCPCKESEKTCPKEAANCKESEKTCPKKDKLVLGVALYGRQFKLKSAKANTPGSAVTAVGNIGTDPKLPGILSYRDICNNLRNTDETKKWTKVEKTKDVDTYAYKGDQWVGYDDKAMAEAKAEFAKDEGLAGVLVWSIDYADWNDECKGGKYPLLTAMKAKLK